MRKVKNGDFLAIHYTGTLENGETFDSSYDREPLEFQVGNGTVIAGFENAVLGLALGDKKAFSLEPDEGYGARDESLVIDFPKPEQEDFKEKLGTTVSVRLKNGQRIPGKVVGINDDKITLDLNPPLAGSVLNFSIEVVYIGDSPKTESCGCGCTSSSCSGC